MSRRMLTPSAYVLSRSSLRRYHSVLLYLFGALSSTITKENLILFVTIGKREGIYATISFNTMSSSPELPFFANMSSGNYSASVGGILTLLALIFVGPIYYGGKHLWRRYLDKKKGAVPEEENAAAEEEGEGNAKKKEEEQNEETGDTEKTEEDSERETYKPMEYMFAMIGYAIGIGNVWRFPYVIASNGGSAALVVSLSKIAAIGIKIVLMFVLIFMYRHTSFVLFLWQFPCTCMK